MGVGGCQLPLLSSPPPPQSRTHQAHMTLCVSCGQDSELEGAAPCDSRVEADVCTDTDTDTDTNRNTKHKHNKTQNAHAHAHAQRTRKRRKRNANAKQLITSHHITAHRGTACVRFVTNIESHPTITVHSAESHKSSHSAMHAGISSLAPRSSQAVCAYAWEYD